MATHSSVLAWRIPGMGEPGGLPSMGSHRVGHDWSDLAAAAAADPNLLWCYDKRVNSPRSHSICKCVCASQQSWKTYKAKPDRTKGEKDTSTAMTVGPPRGSVVKNLPANEGDTRSLSGSEDPIHFGATKPLCHNHWACALEPGNHNYWAHEPQLKKPMCPRACAKQHEKPLQREASAPQLQMRPRYRQLDWKACAATKTQPSQKSINKSFKKTTTIIVDFKKPSLNNR